MLHTSLRLAVELDAEKLNCFVPRHIRPVAQGRNNTVMLCEQVFTCHDGLDGGLSSLRDRISI